MTSHDAPLEASSALQESVPALATQLHFSFLINRAHLAVRNLHYEHAESILTDAIDLASQLSEPTVPQARCSFWQGVIADRTGKDDLAPGLFVGAMPCQFESIEGDYLLQYIRKYRLQIQKTVRESRKAGAGSAPVDLKAWTEALKQTTESVIYENSPLDDLPAESPTQLHHPLPSPRRASVDSEGSAAALAQLTGQGIALAGQVVDKEDKRGSSESPKRRLVSTVPHSLPDHGLMKAIPLGSLQESTLVQQLHRAGSISTQGSPNLSSSPKLDNLVDIEEEVPPQPKSVKRKSSTRLAMDRMSRTIYKKLLASTNIPRQDQSSEPAMPSPLRKASLPGEDWTRKRSG